MKASPGFGLAFSLSTCGFDTASPTQPPLYVMLNLFQDLFLANFAVVCLVCSNWLAGCCCLLSCDCEALSAYAIFNLAEVVDVDFSWLFAGVFGTFNLDDCSWSCPWSSEEFNLFFAVFCVVAGKKHSAAQCAR